MLLCDLLPCKLVYDKIIYTYKYIIDFVNVGNKLLNVGRKAGNDKSHTGHLVGHIGIFCLCITAAQYRQSTDFSNGPHSCSAI
jgi:hypothetical protein